MLGKLKAWDLYTNKNKWNTKSVVADFNIQITLHTPLDWDLKLIIITLMSSDYFALNYTFGRFKDIVL